MGKATFLYDSGVFSVQRRWYFRTKGSRLLLQAVWVIVAIAAPWFHFLAGTLPLLFPRITIYYL